jgi:hypothetical protein
MYWEKLSNSIEECFFRGSGNFSTGQKITHLCGIRMLRFVLTWTSLLKQVNPVHSITLYFFKIYFNIILPYMPVNPERSLPFRFSDWVIDRVLPPIKVALRLRSLDVTGSNLGPKTTCSDWFFWVFSHYVQCLKSDQDQFLSYSLQCIIH